MELYILISCVHCIITIVIKFNILLWNFAGIKAQYPGASVVNKRYIKCVYGQEIQLNKARVAQSFASNKMK